MNSVIVLFGPTASGKSSLALRLAEYADIEIVSADSRQIYRFLDIGTAKPTKHEQQLVKHHCLDIVDPDERYSAGQFRRDAEKAIHDVIGRNKIPVVVGGSGLYVQALLGGVFESDDAVTNDERNAVRNSLRTELERVGRDAMFEELERVDAESAEKIVDKNPVRILRALEYFRLTGRRWSADRASELRPPPFDYRVFVLDRDVDELRDRIATRTQEMWDAGLLDETRSLLDRGYNENVQGLRTVGYKECLALLRKEIEEKNVVELITIATRQYAKRQRTWARHQLAGAQSLNAADPSIVHQLQDSILKLQSE